MKKFLKIANDDFLEVSIVTASFYVLAEEIWRGIVSYSFKFEYLFFAIFASLMISVLITNEAKK